MKKLLIILSIGMVVGAQAQIRFTEFASGSIGGGTGLGEFIEITNIGGSAIDLTGWSFDDLSAVPGAFSISGLGVLAAGSSAIITENADANAFRTGWGLSGSVAVIGGLNQNLSSGGDALNLFDASNTLVDTLVFTNQANLGVSNNGPADQLGMNNYPAWQASSIGDTFGSHLSTNGDVGNPGSYTPVPEPATLLVTGLGFAGVWRSRKRRR